MPASEAARRGRPWSSRRTKRYEAARGCDARPSQSRARPRRPGLREGRTEETAAEEGGALGASARAHGRPRREVGGREVRVGRKVDGEEVDDELGDLERREVPAEESVSDQGRRRTSERGEARREGTHFFHQIL